MDKRKKVDVLVQEMLIAVIKMDKERALPHGVATIVLKQINAICEGQVVPQTPGSSEIGSDLVEGCG
jgi:hypothetical protein